MHTAHTHIKTRVYFCSSICLKCSVIFPRFFSLSRPVPVHSLFGLTLFLFEIHICSILCAGVYCIVLLVNFAVG